MIHITKPGRVLSFDETRLTMDCTDSSKSKQERIVKPDKDDDGEVLVNKGGGVDASGVGGSTADGDSLAPLFIFGGADSYKAEWTQGAPRSTDTARYTGREYIINIQINTAKLDSNASVRNSG
ncbi:hypothetical protein CYMTET_8543 [Cymbomonas tetramitiformis]|uniref:Uncharacterized protein n=1 Tax=Cymbomonas tetramitiformis TaxID=36881 RepID=A0AAE0GTK6_9CHLO|nr:hypothetical protein CYMTET_8543 [Cymbomonas tetramitiformis]